MGLLVGGLCELRWPDPRPEARRQVLTFVGVYRLQGQHEYRRVPKPHRMPLFPRISDFFRVFIRPLQLLRRQTPLPSRTRQLLLLSLRLFPLPSLL